MINIKNLKKSFAIGFFKKNIDVIKDISFDVNPNEIFAFVGPNGAGKTTTLKMITGLITPDSGSITIDGIDSKDIKSRRNLGYLPEISYYYNNLTGAEILDFYASLYGLTGKNKHDKVKLWLEKVGLKDAANKTASKFSKGMLQRLGLAQALIADPQIVILDEPQSGLDPIGRRDVMNIIRDAKNNGQTILFSSHILHDVEKISDRIAIIKNGKIAALGTIEEIMKSTGDLEQFFVKETL